jgi:hypothetical protein
VLIDEPFGSPIADLKHGSRVLRRMRELQDVVARDAVSGSSIIRKALRFEHHAQSGGGAESSW